MRKPAFCICENKDADQLRGNREADQRLCFCYTDSAIPLLPKVAMSYTFLPSPQNTHTQKQQQTKKCILALTIMQVALQLMCPLLHNQTQKYGLASIPSPCGALELWLLHSTAVPTPHTFAAVLSLRCTRVRSLQA